MSIVVNKAFNEKLSSCIERPLIASLGEYGASLVDHLIISEIKRSFKIELRKGATLNEAIEEACRTWPDD